MAGVKNDEPFMLKKKCLVKYRKYFPKYSSRIFRLLVSVTKAKDIQSSMLKIKNILIEYSKYSTRIFPWSALGTRVGDVQSSMLKIKNFSIISKSVQVLLTIIE